jgi:hypothetical protein
MEGFREFCNYHIFVNALWLFKLENFLVIFAIPEK